MADTGCEIEGGLGGIEWGWGPPGTCNCLTLSIIPTYKLQGRGPTHEWVGAGLDEIIHPPIRLSGHLPKVWTSSTEIERERESGEKYVSTSNLVNS